MISVHLVESLLYVYIFVTHLEILSPFQLLPLPHIHDPDFETVRLVFPDLKLIGN